MFFITVTLSRVFEASPINAGALDGFTHVFLNPAHALALLVMGFLCARLGARGVLAGMLGFAAAFLTGAALGLAGITVPLAATLAAFAAVVAAAGVAVGPRWPAAATVVLTVAYGAFAANAYAGGVQQRGSYYALFYLATLAVASIGLTWCGLAVGFACLRTPTGAAALRLAGVGAAAAAGLAWVAQGGMS